MKKKSASKPKKSSKPRKTVSTKKAPKKSPERMPVSTFDAWIAKQVRAGKKEIPPETIVPSKEPTVLPKDTYEIWIENQKPREVIQQKPVSPVPDTFDAWMSKQVASRANSGEKGQATPPSGPASSPVS